MSSSSKMTQTKKKRAEEIDKSFSVQRRRVWRACENCRRKKIKCDGNEPVCTQCQTAKTQCTWLQTKDRAALSRHYVQELENRLLHMENLFTQITPVLEQIGQGPEDGGQPDPSNAQLPGKLSPDSTSLIQAVLPKVREFKNDDSIPEEPEDYGEDEDMAEAFDQLALDEHGHLRWIGGSSTMSLIQSFRALTASPLQRVSPMEDDPRSAAPSANKLYFPASVFFGRVRALPGPEEVEYPERDLCDKLVEGYFSRFHFLLPILDKPTFMRQYAYLMQHTHNPTPAGVETAFISLVFAVFACASRFVEDPRLKTSPDDDGGMGMVYYERALILHYIAHASVQIMHVQIFTLMSAFLCSVNCLPQAWLLTGQAVRSAQDLGLHRSPKRLSLSATEKEGRRKIWWGVYSLDRMLALALGRPLGVEDSDCDIELPADVEDEALPEYFSGAQMTNNQPSLMAGYIALISLYRIAGNVLRKVYSLDTWREALDQEKKDELQRTVEGLDQELTKWCDNLPDVFKSAPTTDQQVSMGTVLCSHYYSVLTTLHRNFLPGKRDHLASAKSTARSLSSARSCIRLASSMKNVVPSSLHSTFYLQNLFSSAVIILLYAMHVPDKQASNAAMEEARSCLDAIGSWEGYWPGARKCKDLLLDLTNTACEAMIKRAINPRSTSLPRPASGRRASVERPARRKPGRPRSRDVHNLSQDDATRQRSTSRKRPLEDDIPEHSPVRSGRFSDPHTPYPRHARKLSAHSSPGSATAAASPPILSAEPSLGAMDSPTFSGNNGHQSPTLHMGAGSPFDYNFNLSQGMSPNWTNSALQGPSAADASMPYILGGFNSHGIDTSLGPMDMMDLSATSDFAATGLPFRGLDFIRNYHGDGYGTTNDQTLWQSFDAGAFVRDPDMPFTLQDSHIDSNNIFSSNT